MAINGAQYAWEDINVVILGRIINGIEEVKYKVKKDKTAIYGRGKNPIAFGRSKKEYDGSISILQSELEALQASVPSGKDITDLDPFDITISYSYDANPGIIVVDILRNCSFMEFEKGMKTGDTHMVVNCPLQIGKIDYNV